MLRKIRVIFACISLLLITLLFLDFSGILHLYFGWMAKIQFIPAVLATHAAIIIFLIALTFIVGRIYCSVICPLGIIQDVVARWGKKSKKNRYSYSRAKTWLRIAFLIVFVIALLLGGGIIAALLDPYAIYGRFASNLLAPIYRAANNLLAMGAEHINSYAFYEVDIWLKSIGTLIIAAVSCGIIAILAWKNGRTYCNTVCPVGTVLGYISKFSLLKPVYNADKCNGCKLCTKNCKASCIDTANYNIDYTRCVTCMDCIEKCKQGAIKYQWAYGKKSESPSFLQNETKGSSDNSRRSFLTIASALTVFGALKAQKKIAEGGLAVIEQKQIPQRATPIIPPGGNSIRHFTQHCTACGLCISACPNGVLRPSSNLSTYMQPEMSYERGFCRPECNECSQVCPNGAIKPLAIEDKSSSQIGFAVWIRENCVVVSDDVTCGNCARHCPNGAITMIKLDENDATSKEIPTVDTERCIGCGACEYLCPSRPFSAIYVEGTEKHRLL